MIINSRSRSTMDNLPGINAKWHFEDISVDYIEKTTDELIKSMGKDYDNVGLIKPEDVTFANTVQALIDLEREQSTLESPLDFLQHVSPDKAIRDASVAAEKKLSAFGVEISMKKDLFDNVCTFKEKIGLDGLTEEQKRWVEKTIIAGRRSGLHLGKETRDAITAIKKKIADLGTQFSFNLNEDTSHVYFTVEELEGVPQDLIDSLEKVIIIVISVRMPYYQIYQITWPLSCAWKKILIKERGRKKGFVSNKQANFFQSLQNDEGKCKVTMQYPHFFPASKKAKNPETRRRLETCYQSRCMVENTKILEELVELRHQQAELLGYANHASYVHELRMAKSPENVTKFLSELAAKLQPLWSEEKAELLALKAQECKDHDWEFDGKLNFWDMKYYCNLIEETKYSVDQQKLKEYFPLHKVTQGLLKIYQELLCLKFQIVENVHLWHEDVTMVCRQS